MNDESDEDVPQLSLDTFAVLQEFYKEQEERECASKEVVSSSKDVEIAEDWQLSQFWYDDNTIEELVNIAFKTIGVHGKVALISCPSLYQAMKNRLGINSEVHLYEFDKRFAVYGNDFTMYDYKMPLAIPRDKSGYYDLVIADPPFLSDECLTKTAVTVKYLTENKIILCTGAVMAPMADRLLNLQKIDFEPRHKSNLGNEFWCYTNFEVKS